MNFAAATLAAIGAITLIVISIIGLGTIIRRFNK